MEYILSILFFASCGLLSQITARDITRKNIVGGDDVQEGQYAYSVSLQNVDHHVCGGGIIGDSFILTAAHCVLDNTNEFEDDFLVAIIGLVDLRKIDERLGIRIIVEEMFVPRMFEIRYLTDNTSKRSEGDIAVLKLKEPIGLDGHPFLTKLKLSFWSLFDYPGKKAIITGYGDNVVQVFMNTETGELIMQGESFERMRYAETKIIKKSVCQTLLTKELHSSHLCARVTQREANIPEGVCSGDSGGPLVRDGNVIVGVFSSGTGFCDESIGIGVYTRVTSFKSFIKNAMRGIRSPDMRAAKWYNLEAGCSSVEPYLREEGVDYHSDESSNGSPDRDVHV